MYGCDIGAKEIYISECDVKALGLVLVVGSRK